MKESIYKKGLLMLSAGNLHSTDYFYWDTELERFSTVNIFDEVWPHILDWML